MAGEEVDEVAVLDALQLGDLDVLSVEEELAVGDLGPVAQGAVRQLLRLLLALHGQRRFVALEFGRRHLAQRFLLGLKKSKHHQSHESGNAIQGEGSPCTTNATTKER